MPGDRCLPPYQQGSRHCIDRPSLAVAFGQQFVQLIAQKCNWGQALAGKSKSRNPTLMSVGSRTKPPLAVNRFDGNPTETPLRVAAGIHYDVRCYAKIQKAPTVKLLACGPAAFLGPLGWGW